MIKKTETIPPIPDLQELVARFRRYDKMTPEAWPEYDPAIETYRALRRLRPEDQRAITRRFIPDALASSVSRSTWRPNLPSSPSHEMRSRQPWNGRWAPFAPIPVN
jgi:hypothetical protein